MKKYNPKYAVKYQYCPLVTGKNDLIIDVFEGSWIDDRKGIK